jgi:hypothetical protein
VPPCDALASCIISCKVYRVKATSVLFFACASPLPPVCSGNLSPVLVADSSAAGQVRKEAVSFADRGEGELFMD